MISPDEWAMDEYDRLVAELADADGLPLGEAAKEFQRRYIGALQHGKIQRPQADDWQDGVHLFNRVVKPGRDRRSKGLATEMEYIRDALNDDTILGRDDPRFQQAHRLGTADGRDKILGLWSVDDWRNVAMIRYRNAAEATAAAAKFDQLQQEITAAMQRRGVAATWDLFNEVVEGDEE